VTPVRLPADAVLIVIDVQEAIDDPRSGPRNNLAAESNIAARTPNSVEATARHAGNLGRHRFVVEDVCLGARQDLRGRHWPAEDVHPLSLAHSHGEYASVVNTVTTTRAAATAKARELRAAGLT
jgi:nicotinamidase-related amidase